MSWSEKKDIELLLRVCEMDIVVDRATFERVAKQMGTPFNTIR